MGATVYISNHPNLLPLTFTGFFHVLFVISEAIGGNQAFLQFKNSTSAHKGRVDEEKNTWRQFEASMTIEGSYQDHSGEPRTGQAESPRCLFFEPLGTTHPQRNVVKIFYIARLRFSTVVSAGKREIN